ncbi:MAG: histidine phosphatase family protein [Desulfomonile tiedjei]|uniref:Histidine phosphatase family protein n=1 Tax=Desulfomonile tiedjei TaxID=2358 RepID=A0A9D6V5U6_9BACT|nr:histidine phosphatase family protein [Desulfomonile tiedjei]
MRRFAAIISVLLLIVSASSDGLAQIGEKDLVTELQKGGYNIFIRHPKTDPTQADIDPLNLDNIGAQRQLSEEGRQQATALGETFRALKIPVDKVISSKFHRAYETSRLLAVGDVTTSIDVSEGGLVVSPNENNRRTAALRALLEKSPQPGKNTVIVSHKPNLVDAAGKDFVDMAEGEAAIFKPTGNGKFVLVGRVTVQKWAEMAK